MHSSDNYDDLNELIDEDDIIDGGAEAELFQQATTYVQSAAGSLDNTVLLKLYAHYKQVTEGTCKSENRPSWYDFRAKSKFDAWHALGDMSRSDARACYVDIVRSLGHNFTANATGKNEQMSLGIDKDGESVLIGKGSSSDKDVVKNGAGWVTHSTLQQCGGNEDEDFGDKVSDVKTKTFLDLISSNDLPAVKHHLSLYPELLSGTCGRDLLTPCHYAADRGSAHVLEHLLVLSKDIDARAQNVDVGRARAVDVRDSDGQTALHYASACGHADCCSVLLGFGAIVEVADNEGQTCLDVAADGSVRELLLAAVGTKKGAE